ncbi:hypothetical protein D3C84_402970 [compost metagenome]
MITYVYEPHRLILTWRPAYPATNLRKKLAVAELLHVHNNVIFRYLYNTEDYDEACRLGFIGHPAFSIFEEVHNFGVMDAFIRRLPPRRRSDFNLYLKQYGLNADLPASDFALLGYTGARLPSDPFELFMDLSAARPPVDLLLEIAGFKYTQPNVDTQDVIGMSLRFEREPTNEFDPKAIAIFQDSYKIGYVSRVLCDSFWRLLSRGFLDAKICTLNGTKGKTTAYMLINYRSTSLL